METTNDHNHDNYPLGIDLNRIKIPQWLSLYFSLPNICERPDIDEMLIDGYPQDDDF
ncbi:hypothetical protein GV828_02785 [Flavobacterium sp. NST-5]|uniref:Uncharacterized protein n=1 Tax=Flavobacterium ichthyis TaxID=2698827 RepID=A0ABW9Z9V7_9FLAO|nr:hypothetical protein [Flavobacterium ichthyis]NBL64122.1 hypothetical protein [Flavobacterium ichthyis]